MNHKNRLMFAVSIALLLSIFMSLTAGAATQAPDAGGPANVAKPKVVMPDKWSEHLRAPADVHLLQMLRADGTIPLNASESQAQVAMDDWYKEFYGKNPGANPEEFAKRSAAVNQFLSTGESQASALAVPEKATLVAVVDFSGPDTIERLWPDPSDPTKCVTQTFTFQGPKFGETAAPGPKDNFTLWKPSWTAEDYKQLYFGVGPTAGIGVVRPDLGGIDLAGMTLANYVQEQSGGTHMPKGDVLDKVLTLPHAHNWYGAARARQTDEACEIVNSDAHYLDYFVDAIKAVQAAYPNLDYSKFDTDGDRNVDLFAVIHAGWDWQSFGGVDALSTSSSGFPQPYQIGGLGTPGDPSDDYFIQGINVIPEQLDAGAICEEYEHQFGLPDIYTTDQNNSNAWWGSHSSGVWGGPVGGARPMGHNLWQDVFLGWRTPKVINYDDPAMEVTLGRARYTPDNTEDGLIIRLPDKVKTIANPIGTGKAIWSDRADDYDATLSRSWDLSGVSEPIIFSFDASWDIEEDWDYFYFEVSIDGQNFTSVADLDGKLTDTNPNGNNLGWGLTGAGKGKLRFGATPIPGVTTVWTRLHYKTDAGVNLPGMFIDNISVDAGSANLYKQDFEGDISDWTNMNWQLVPFTQKTPMAYFAEWRTKIGFDKSFDDVYHVVYNNDEMAELNVDRTPYSVPAMQLTLYDASQPFDYTLWDASRNESPSYGPKYPLLVVDSHPWPYIFDTKFSSVSGGYIGPKVGGRSAAGDGGFSLTPTKEWTLRWGYDYATGQYVWPALETKTFASRPAVPAFHDSMGYYPGFFYPDTGSSVYGWDSTASAVVPAKGNYTTKITNLDGDLYYDLFGTPIGPGGLGTGNPGDNNVQYGVHLAVLAGDGEKATVRFWNALTDIEGALTQTPMSAVVTTGSHIDVNVKATNIGGMMDAFFYVPIDADVAYVPDSAYGGAYPVTAGAAAGLAAKYGAASLAAPEGVAAETVVGVAYEAPGLATGGAVDFGFHGMVTASAGTVEHTAAVSAGGKLVKTITSAPLKIDQKVTEAAAVTGDTYLHSGEAGINYGSAAFLHTRVSAAGLDYLRSLLAFNVPAVESGKLVKAELSVYLDATSGGAVDGELRAYEVTTAWAEDAATWNAPWVQPGGDYVEPAVGGAAIDKSMVGKWVTIDVTPLVAKWGTDPASNHGLMLRLRKVSSITGYRFASADTWAPEHAPKLTVTYWK